MLLVIKVNINLIIIILIFVSRIIIIQIHDMCNVVVDYRPKTLFTSHQHTILLKCTVAYTCRNVI